MKGGLLAGCYALWALETAGFHDYERLDFFFNSTVLCQVQGEIPAPGTGRAAPAVRAVTDMSAPPR